MQFLLRKWICGLAHGKLNLHNLNPNQASAGTGIVPAIQVDRRHRNDKQLSVLHVAGLLAMHLGV